MFGYVFEKNHGNEAVAIDLDKVSKIRVVHPDEDDRSKGYLDHISFEYEDSRFNEEVCFGTKEEADRVFASLVPIWKK